MSSLFDSSENRTKLVEINSRDRVNKSDSTTNFSVSLGRDAEIANVHAIVLKEVHFTNGVYKINERNNIFRFDIGGPTTKEFAVPIGHYTVARLIAALPALFVSVGESITIIQNALTKKLQITATGQPYNFYDTSSAGTVNPIAEALGICGESGLVATYNFPDLPNLSGLTTLYIRSPQLAHNNSLESRGLGSNGDIFEVIEVDQSFGVVVHRDSHDFDIDSVVYSENNTNLENIHIRLTDDQNRTINNNGTHISMTFKIFYS